MNGKGSDRRPALPRSVAPKAMAILNCHFCGQLTMTIPICDWCWETTDQPILDRTLLTMPIDWPCRELYRKFIRSAAKRHPEFIEPPWSLAYERQGK